MGSSECCFHTENKYSSGVVRIKKYESFVKDFHLGESHVARNGILPNANTGGKCNAQTRSSYFTEIKWNSLSTADNKTMRQSIARKRPTACKSAMKMGKASALD